MAAAFRFMRAPGNRDEVVKTIQDTTGSNEEIARDILKLYFEPDRRVFPKQGELDLKGLGQMIQFMSETGDLKPRAAMICDTLINARIFQRPGCRFTELSKAMAMNGG